jgi:integrase/recombinase XerD
MTELHALLRATRLIWPPAFWPAHDRAIWERARLGQGPLEEDSPAFRWRAPTIKNTENGYGRYLAWLHKEGLLVEDEEVEQRITKKRVASYRTLLNATISPVSAAMMIGTLSMAARALSPETDWSWLIRQYGRLKRKAKSSRDKRRAMQETPVLYHFGQALMGEAQSDGRHTVGVAQRYQAGLVISLLAARPLRIRNMRMITIGKSLCWDGTRYWLKFGYTETKTAHVIDEPLPDDLAPYLEAFLRIWRPVLLRQARRYGGDPTHRRLWVDRYGAPMAEATLRSMIERYTAKQFGTAIWPHLFRDCLLTSLATDRPDLMAMSPTLLGHVSANTGEQHYNQARMLGAGKRFSANVSELRAGFLSADGGERGSL